MAMPLAVPRYTLQDLESFPDDGNRYELVDGILLVTPAPLPPHDYVVWRLIRRLTLYVGSDTGVHVSCGAAVEVAPNLHLEPDVLVMPEILPVPATWTDVREWWLAVEVSGRGSRIYDRDFKRPAYLRAGVREVWRADLKEKCVFVATPARPEEARHEERVLWHPPAKPEPMVVDVPGLFHGVEGDD